MGFTRRCWLRDSNNLCNTGNCECRLLGNGTSFGAFPGHSNSGRLAFRVAVDSYSSRFTLPVHIEADRDGAGRLCDAVLNRLQSVIERISQNRKFHIRLCAGLDTRARPRSRVRLRPGDVYRRLRGILGAIHGDGTNVPAVRRGIDDDRDADEQKSGKVELHCE